VKRPRAFALPLLLTASHWLGAPALAVPTGSAAATQRTTLTRLRTVHEMVTSHARDLESTTTGDGTRISAVRQQGGTRVSFSYKDGGEAEYHLDEQGRTRSLITLRGSQIRSYRSVGTFKRSDGSAGEALWSADGEAYDLRLHFDAPIGPAKKVTVVIAPTKGSKPVLIRELDAWGVDVVQASFDRKQVLEHSGGAPVRAWAEIKRADADVVRVSLTGPFGLGD
jgi:hypothetical protein